MQYITYSGSRLYGCDTNESDVDLRGFYIPEYQALLGRPCNNELASTLKQTISTKYSAKDVDLWTVGHFFSLLEKGSCIAIEMLFVPPEKILHDCYAAQVIRENRELFLSDRMIQSFYGYAKSCWERRQVLRLDDSDSQLQDRLRHGRSKDTYHSLRILLELWELLEKKQITFPLSPNLLRSCLIDIKLGRVHDEQLIEELYRELWNKCRTAEKSASFGKIDFEKTNDLYFDIIAHEMGRYYRIYEKEPSCYN